MARNWLDTAEKWLDTTLNGLIRLKIAWYIWNWIDRVVNGPLVVYGLFWEVFNYHSVIAMVS